MDYESVPTTVFTPIEYGTIGLSEDEAIQRYGAEGFTIDAYHTKFKPLEWEFDKENTLRIILCGVSQNILNETK